MSPKTDKDDAGSCHNSEDMDAMKPANIVNLYISCSKLINLDQLSKTDPTVELYMLDEVQNKWILDEQTEV